MEKSQLKSITLGLLISISILFSLEFILSFVNIPSFKEPVHFLARSINSNLDSHPFNHFDEELIFKVRPNPNNEIIKGYSGINSNGFRGRELKTNENRIIFFGDSCVFGWGINKLENTLTNNFERLLNSKKFNVYNLGVPGFSSTQVIKLADKVKLQKDDLIVLYFGWNDIWPTSFFTDSQTMDFLFFYTHPILNPIMSSRIYAATSFLFRKMKSQNKNNESSYKPRVPISETKKNIERFIKLTNQKVLLVLPPFNENRLEQNKIKKIQIWKNSIIKNHKNKLHLIDIQNDLKPDDFLEDGFHLSSNGNKKLAKEIYQVISKKGKVSI